MDFSTRPPSPYTKLSFVVRKLVTGHVIIGGSEYLPGKNEFALNSAYRKGCEKMVEAKLSVGKL